MGNWKVLVNLVNVINRVEYRESNQRSGGGRPRGHRLSGQCVQTGDGLSGYAKNQPSFTAFWTNFNSHDPLVRPHGDCRNYPGRRGTTQGTDQAASLNPLDAKRQRNQDK
jgi:hypothetical protein